MSKVSPEVAALFERIEAAGISVPVIADNAGIAPTTLTRWRRGAVSPHPSMLRLVTASLDDLIGRKSAA